MRITISLLFAVSLALSFTACDSGDDTAATTAMTPDAPTESGFGSGTAAEVDADGNMCTPSCVGKICGDDGCGGLCGQCGSGSYCSTDGQCIEGECSPSCVGKMCGDDGCGGLCGQCSDGEMCTDGMCTGGSTPSQPEGTTPGASTGGTCLDILTCFQGCGESDQACLQACVGAASPAGQQAFLALNDCLAAECPDAADQTCAENALATTCSAQANACQSGGSGSGGGSTPGASTGGTCLDILTCFQGCGENDQACLQACVAAASPEGQQTFIALNECLAAACPDAADQACAENALTTTCASQANACQSGGSSGGGGASTPGQAGTGTCNGIIQCFGGCGEDDQACLQACLSQGSQAAQDALFALNDCLVAACPEPADQTCAETALSSTCAPEVAACQSS